MLSVDLSDPKVSTSYPQFVWRFKQKAVMAGSLRFEDKLDGVSNFLSWKVRVTFLLKE